jgi:hypothetical protein
LACQARSRRQPDQAAQMAKKTRMKVQRTVSEANGKWPSYDSSGASNHITSASSSTPRKDSTAGLTSQEKNFFIPRQAPWITELRLA